MTSHVNGKCTFAVVATVLALALVAVAQPALAQQMSFSVYTDAAADGSGVITMWSSVEDDSWGCTHSGYMTTANIISPGGRQASSTSGGLSASTSMPINDELGNYSLYTTGTYDCSCARATAGYGGGISALADEGPAYTQYVLMNAYQDPCGCLVHCFYARCPNASCGPPSIEKVTETSCHLGWARTYTYKKFFFVIYSCILLIENPAADYPC